MHLLPRATAREGSCGSGRHLAGIRRRVARRHDAPLTTRAPPCRRCLCRRHTGWSQRAHTECERTQALQSRPSAPPRLHFWACRCADVHLHSPPPMQTPRAPSLPSLLAPHANTPARTHADGAWMTTSSCLFSGAPPSWRTTRRSSPLVGGSAGALLWRPSEPSFFCFGGCGCLVLPESGRLAAPVPNHRCPTSPPVRTHACTGIHSAEVLETGSPEYLYLGCVRFVKQASGGVERGRRAGPRLLALPLRSGSPLRPLAPVGPAANLPPVPPPPPPHPPARAGEEGPAG